MARRKSHVPDTLNLRNVCPVCRVYDPTWFAHFADCPLASRYTRQHRVVAMVAANYRNTPPHIRYA